MKGQVMILSTLVEFTNGETNPQMIAPSTVDISISHHPPAQQNSP